MNTLSVVYSIWDSEQGKVAKHIYSSTEFEEKLSRRLHTLRLTHEAQGFQKMCCFFNPFSTLLVLKIEKALLCI